MIHITCNECGKVYYNDPQAIADFIGRLKGEGDFVDKLRTLLGAPEPWIEKCEDCRNRPPKPTEPVVPVAIGINECPYCGDVEKTEETRVIEDSYDTYYRTMYCPTCRRDWEEGQEITRNLHVIKTDDGMEHFPKEPIDDEEETK